MVSLLMKHVKKGSLVKRGGFVLLSAVIFIAILTTLLLLSSDLILNQERFSRFSRNHAVAFLSAEAALRDAEIEMGLGRRLVDEELEIEFDSAATNWDVLRVTDGCGEGVEKGLCVCELEGGTSSLAYRLRHDVSFLNQHSASLSEFTRLHTGYDGTSSVVGAAQVPRYVIERCRDERSSDRSYWYRVTALGYGLSSRVMVVLEQVVRP